MKKILWLAVVVFVGLLLYWIFNETPAGQETPAPLMVTIKAVNNFGIIGQATIEENDGQARVSIELSGAPRETTRPAYLRRGSCAASGESIYTLSPVVNDVSETTLTVALAAITGNLPLAISIYESDALTAVVACGEISADD